MLNKDYCHAVRVAENNPLYFHWSEVEELIKKLLDGSGFKVTTSEWPRYHIDWDGSGSHLAHKGIAVFKATSKRKPQSGKS